MSENKRCGEKQAREGKKVWSREAKNGNLKKVRDCYVDYPK